MALCVTWWYLWHKTHEADTGHACCPALVPIPAQVEASKSVSVDVSKSLPSLSVDVSKAAAPVQVGLSTCRCSCQAADGLHQCVRVTIWNGTLHLQAPYLKKQHAPLHSPDQLGVVADQPTPHRAASLPRVRCPFAHRLITSSFSALFTACRRPPSPLTSARPCPACP